MGRWWRSLLSRNKNNAITILGINETSHDASISLIHGGNILFSGHAERYSKEKNDWYNNDQLLKDAFKYGYPDAIAYYENPLLKKTRLLLKGGNGDWIPQTQYKIKNMFGKQIPIYYFKHHFSHAAAGYYTSPFDDAVIVVLDSIGEWSTSTIWVGENEKINLKFKQNYPVSFGLFYSAFTKLLGLKPNQEEYIMMGMAAYGNPKPYLEKVREYFPKLGNQKYNFHEGIKDWPYKFFNEQDKFDVAAAVQQVYEERLIDFMNYAKEITKKKNLVFMGGCALNSKANTLLWNIFEDIWIMPNPGDAGSSLGAAAALYGKHINWQTPYLGYNIQGEYPVNKIITELLKNKIVAVANGRAEFGPRALGNRSILADPRDPDIKNKVNLIKKREEFRPFAPVVLEEYASKWFDMDYKSPYMQYTPKCLKPEIIPSVVHYDGTSRVQTVNYKQHPGLHRVLSEWCAITGIPVLLNTSLNIKNQPLLNDEQDIFLWEKEYNTKIVGSNDE